MLEFIPEVGNGLIDQEDSYSHEQQVYEEENDREDVFQAGLAETHRRAVAV